MNETRNAIGIPMDANFLNLDNGHGFSYTSDQPQVTYIYKRVIDAGLRVLVYEGDSDACGLETAPVQDVFVAYFKSIGLNKTQRWRPWTIDGAKQMGGYVIEWNDNQASFVSIRGAGHLVPLNRPSVSLKLLKSFTSGHRLPHYVK